MLFVTVAGRSESETRVQLNLTPSADSRENSTDIAGEITRNILEDGVSIASKCERALRVAWDCKIWAIKQIVSFRSKRNLHPL